MKNKVKVTVEQKVLIERLNTMDCFKVDVVSYVAKKEKIPNSNYRPLEGLTLAELLKVLYEPNSYEVGLQYNVGDWVTRHESVMSEIDEGQKGFTFKVESVTDTHVIGEGTYHLKSSVRHSTLEEIKLEKEKKLWAKICREVGEFRKGDGLIDENGVIFHIGDTSNSEIGFITPSTASIWYSNGHMRGFFPVESLVSFDETQ